MKSHHKWPVWRGALVCQAVGLLLLAPSRAEAEAVALTSGDEIQHVLRAFRTGSNGASGKADAGQLEVRKFGRNRLLIGYNAEGSVAASLTCLLCTEDELMSEAFSLGAVVVAKSRGGRTGMLETGNAEPDGRIYVDGISLTPLLGEHPIDPGTHQITSVSGGEVKRASVHIPEGGRAALPTFEAVDPGRRARVRAAVITCGLGLTAAAVGGLFVWLDDNCADKECSLKHTYMNVPGIALLATGALVQGIVIWLLLPRHHSKKGGVN